MTSGRLIFMAVMALSLTPSLARSQETGGHDGVRKLTEDEQQALLVHLREAREAYEQGDYERALVSFESAYRIEPLSSIWFFRGQSLERLGREQEAIDAYERFIAVAPEDERVALTRRTIETLQSRLTERQQVTFQIVTEPSGATVLWQAEGGEPQRGSSPLSVEAKAGQVLTFRIELEGFESLSKTVTFEQGGALIWEPTLRPLPETSSQTITPPEESRAISSKMLWVGAASSALVSTAAFLNVARTGRQLDQADAMRGEPGAMRPENYDALRIRHNSSVAIGWGSALGAAAFSGAALFVSSKRNTSRRAWQAGFMGDGDGVALHLQATF